MSRELGDKWLVSSLLGTLGDMALTEGDLERAADNFRECLAVGQELGAQQIYLPILLGFAEVAGAQ